jgi:hypothetical protein
LIWSNGRVLRHLSLHLACAVALSERGVVVERHFAILADKDESARKRRVPGGRLKRGQELLTACELSPSPEAACWDGSCSPAWCSACQNRAR